MGRKEPHAMTTKVLSSHRSFKQFEQRIVLGDVSLSEVVCAGAQLMLQHAVELEMSAFLARDYYRNAPGVTAERGRRNGYEKHTVLTGEGPIEVAVPQVRDLPEEAARYSCTWGPATGRATRTGRRFRRR
jgi:hypothetical protein